MMVASLIKPSEAGNTSKLDLWCCDGSMAVSKPPLDTRYEQQAVDGHLFSTCLNIAVKRSIATL